MKRSRLKNIVAGVTLLATLAINSAEAATAKISEFKLIHTEATIKSNASYAKLNKLSDADLKKTVIAPEQGDFITVKKGTRDLRDGNTRVYILLQRGFGTLVVPYDELDSSITFYDF